MATAAENCEYNEYDLQIMTVNANGPATVNAATRINLLVKLWNDIQPDITAFQEFKWGSRGPLSKWPETICNTGNPEASIMIDIQNTLCDFDIIKDPKNTLQPENFVKGVHKRLLDTNAYRSGMAFTPLSRMAMRQITIPRKDDNGERLSFIIVSWHGNWKGELVKSLKDRLNEFTDMCTFVGTIAKKLNLPFMVAGDFNLDSTLAEQSLERPSRLDEFDLQIYGRNVVDYSEDKRHEWRESKTKGTASRFIDFFITGGIDTTNLNRIKIVQLHTIDIIKYGSGKINPIDNKTYPLDHDPILAYVELCRYDRVTSAQDMKIITKGYVTEEKRVQRHDKGVCKVSTIPSCRDQMYATNAQLMINQQDVVKRTNTRKRNERKINEKQQQQGEQFVSSFIKMGTKTSSNQTTDVKPKSSPSCIPKTITTTPAKQVDDKKKPKKKPKVAPSCIRKTITTTPEKKVDDKKKP